MQKKFLARLLLITAPCLASFTMPQQGVASGGLAKATVPTGTLISAEQQYYAFTGSLIRSSVPLKTAANRQNIPSDQPKNDPTFMSYSIDKNGFVTQLSMLKDSNSLATDFWTMWAVASCPPIKRFEPASKTLLPMSIDISENFDGTTVEPHHQARIALETAIARKANANYVYIPLIPPAFAETFTSYLPWRISLKDVCSKENFVGIPISLLTQNGSQIWSEHSANELIKGHSSIGDLLREWPHFFHEHPKPSSEEIFSYANTLKVKYRKFLKVEGEPEAPLP